MVEISEGIIVALLAATFTALLRLHFRRTAVAELPSSESVGLLVRARRSIFPKDYSGAPAPRAAVDRALSAANWAPTHGKTEPWRFVVFNQDSIPQLLALKRKGMEATLTGPAQAAALEKAAKKEAELCKCSHIIVICCKRVANAKGALMPEWEESAAVACAVQNMHLSLHADGCAGYWSSGGVGGWADAPAVRAFLGMDGECLGARDLVLGFFHVGVAMPGKAEAYRARRGLVEDKVRWVTGPPKG
jgi:nitroreductase